MRSFDRALVIGSADAGRPAARLLARLGIETDVYDRQAAMLAPLREEGFATHSGAWSDRHLREMDLVVTSPGVAQHEAPIVDALGAGIPVWSELELGARQLDLPMIAVTGTNGKTTVTRLVTEMLVASGIAAVSAGNIRPALSEIVLERMEGPAHWDVVVVEASSFGLRFTHDFHPAVAVIVNVAPDHLDWHGGYDGYLAAKAAIWRNQTADDVLVFDESDAGAVRAVAGAPSRLVPVNGSSLPEDAPSGVPAVDFAAAAAAARQLGATTEGIADAVKRFQPERHRRTPVGEWDGVLWVDDSKATNVHAAVAAAAAYDRVVLIAGGRNKGLDLSPLPNLPSVRHTFAIGEAAGELARAGGDRVTIVAALEDAIAAADQFAEPGDTVLLAPGCTSFDMFDDYEARGDEFAAAVLHRKEGT